MAIMPLITAMTAKRHAPAGVSYGHYTKCNKVDQGSIHMTSLSVMARVRVTQGA